jgi:putative inorganic carbon (hco3(-)) transporter
MALRGILLLILIGGSLPVCFLRPLYGIAVWIFIAFLNPQQFTWSADAFPWAEAVGFATIAGTVVFSRGWIRRLASAQLALVAGLWLWFTITTLVSTSTPLFMHHSVDTWYRYTFVSKILLMTFILVAIVDDFRRLRILLNVIAGCFAFYVFKSIPFIILTGGHGRVFGPPNSMIADNNDFGLAMNMSLPLFFFLAQTEPNPWLKLIWRAAFVGGIPTVLFTYSRGALVGLIVVMFLMLLESKRRLVLISVLVLGAAVAVAFAPDAWKARMNPTRSDAVDASAEGRLNAWGFAWHLAEEFPIAGGGFETFTPELFQRYAAHAMDVHGPHSVYFGVLGEHGFVGLGLYLTLVAGCLVSTFRIGRLARALDDPVSESYSKMFRLSLVGFLTSGIFLGRAYFDYYFTIVGCIVILNRLLREQVLEEPVEDFVAMEVP